MASNSYTDHLLVLLQDANHLEDSASQLPTGFPGRPARRATIYRTMVVMCVSSWESYIEAIAIECLELMRPPVPPLGIWTAQNAVIRGQIGRFNNPNLDNVRMIVSDTIGLQDIDRVWHWQNCTVAQARDRLHVALQIRNRIAHGVNPRPDVDPVYATNLALFFRRLARCTDQAIRDHLVNVLGIPNPWLL